MTNINRHVFPGRNRAFFEKERNIERQRKGEKDIDEVVIPNRVS